MSHKPMKNPISVLRIAASLALACALGTSLAQAGYISGTISFDGLTTTNTGNLSGATDFTSIMGFAAPGTQSGSYAGVSAFTSADFTPFSWVGPFATSGLASNPLWTFTVGTTSYSFYATSIHLVTQNANFLDITGAGFAQITGYSDTPGVWTITDSSVGGGPMIVFGSSAAVAAVPDSGGVALLTCLGLATLGVAGYARRGKSARN